MAICCLISLTTTAGTGYVEVCINSLHQLALIMPAPVISYEVQRQVDQTIHSQNILDNELYDLLIGLLDDIEKGQKH